MEFIVAAMKQLEKDYGAVLNQTHLLENEIRSLKEENQKWDEERRVFQKQVLEILYQTQKSSNFNSNGGPRYKNESIEVQEDDSIINSRCEDLKKLANNVKSGLGRSTKCVSQRFRNVYSQEKDIKDLNELYGNYKKSHNTKLESRADKVSVNSSNTNPHSVECPAKGKIPKSVTQYGTLSSPQKSVAGVYIERKMASNGCCSPWHSSEIETHKFEKKKSIIDDSIIDNL
ncbi:hypothetical protein TorRG33x02_119850 [Trema orientale]|uniref:Uncharacterized protein n=1 Tax=Trema orientale TaxID=63057 RepID=A0A2P5F2Y9_TREOI|nr:hypothetical protein TorRG33x02_119850 [Trema orientale]